jgi:hypothetical protein
MNMKIKLMSFMLMTTNAFKNMQLTSGQNLVALSVSGTLKIHAHMPPVLEAYQ